MNRGRGLLIPAIAIWIGGCTPGGRVHVHAYWGTTTERMPRFSTYDWHITQREADAASADPKLHALIRVTIDHGLSYHGYIRSAGGAQPDFLVSYRAGSGFQPSDTGPANRALLAIEARTPDDRPIWSGWADGAIDPSLTPEVRKARIEQVIRTILDQFAPSLAPPRHVPLTKGDPRGLERWDAGCHWRLARQCLNGAFPIR